MAAAVPTPADVERYAFCAHAWRLGRSQDEQESDGLARGIAAHRRIAGLLHEARRAEAEAKAQLRWSFRVLAVAAAAGLLALQAAFFQGGVQGVLMVVASLVVLNCSVGLLTLALYDRRRAQDIQDRLGFEDDPAMDGLEAPSVTDPEWGIEGQRGCVLLAGSKAIPIDARAGATPRDVRPEHLLHMAGRLRLQEVLDGSPPGYGLVAYPHGVFRVDWDAEGQGDLRKVLQAIQAAEASGTADRDHDDPQRCRQCTFRKGCDQRLQRP